MESDSHGRPIGPSASPPWRTKYGAICLTKRGKSSTPEKKEAVERIKVLERMLNRLTEFASSLVSMFRRATRGPTRCQCRMVILSWRTSERSAKKGTSHAGESSA